MKVLHTAISDPYLPETPARTRDVFYALFAGIVMAGLLGGLAHSLIGPPEGGSSGSVSSLALAVSLAAQSLGSLGIFWWLSATRGSGDWATDFGLRVRLRDAWWLFAGLVLQLVAAILIWPVVQLFAPDDAPRQSIVVAAEEATGTATRLLLLVLIVVVAVIVEEIVFRGMVLAMLRRRMGPWPAILLSGAAFSLLHFLLDPDAILAVPGLFIIGIGLGWAALRTGDLSAPIFIHAGVNFTGAVVLLFGEDLGVEAAVRFVGLT